MSDPQTNPSLTHTAFLWLCLGALLCCQQAKGQTTFNVPSDFATIQQALDASASGDTILVSPGKYPQNLNFDGKEVTLRSTDGPESTHINVNGGTAVTIANQAEISGFTISGARNTFGAGMSVSGVGTIIRGNIFDGNVQSAGGFGAAIAGNTASPVIDSNIFRNNTSDFQFTSGVVAFVNSSAPQIVNNIFHDNNSRAINLTLPTGNNPHVINNTFVDNAVGIRVDRRVDSSAIVFRNNILTDNQIGLEVDFGNEANNPTWDHNLVFANGIDYETISDQTGLNGNLSLDPQFFDPMSNNYQLAMDSPAIDAGASLDAPNADFIGTMRPLDGNNDGMFQYDIGAFEAIPVPEPAIGMPLAIALALLFSRSRSKTRGRDHSAKV